MGSIMATFMWIGLVKVCVGLVLLQAIFKKLALVLCLSSSGLLEEHLDSEALFFFSLLLVFGSLVFVQDSFNFVFGQEPYTFIQDIQMHLDDFGLLAHTDVVIDVQRVVFEGEVADLGNFLGVVLLLSFFSRIFRLLILYCIFELKSIFTSQVLKVFNVLKVDLFYNFL
jgi:hypothetical protein